ncbi:MAG: hypothetical protein L6R37_003773 [Teloschistes peruensis]|nr:MAG: hypothetical protein L6R37_003773 [Teloschistes peruensis]
MATTEEGTHICADGTKLYTKTWKILFIHGFSDHCNAYNGLFPTLAGRGILVHAFDQRGWGRSVTKVAERGLTGPTSQVLDDISSVLKGQLPTNVPLFLMGHSMGGGQVLMVRRIERSYLCRDEEMCKAYEADDLCHDTGTLEGLAGMLRRAEELDQGKVLLNDVEGCRLWVGHGTEDRVTSFKATARFMDRLQINDKTFRVYDRHYHKLHDEPGEDKIKFANDVADWILARSSSPHIMTVVPNETASKL